MAELFFKMVTIFLNLINRQKTHQIETVTTVTIQGFDDSNNGPGVYDRRRPDRWTVGHARHNLGLAAARRELQAHLHPYDIRKFLSAVVI